jgi:hypothetical protein
MKLVRKSLCSSPVLGGIRDVLPRTIAYFFSLLPQAAIGFWRLLSFPFVPSTSSPLTLWPLRTQNRQIASAHARANEATQRRCSVFLEHPGMRESKGAQGLAGILGAD